MTDQPDDRSSLAMAVVRASHVTTIALEMALPALLGHWIDHRWDTRPWFLVLGALFGFVVGMWHLVRLAANCGEDSTRPDARGDPPNSPQSDGRNKEP